MRQYIFFLFFILLFFCLTVVGSTAIAGEIILSGPDWQVARICQEINYMPNVRGNNGLFSGAVIKQVTTSGPVRIDFRDDNGFNVASEVIPTDRFSYGGRVLSARVLTMIRLSQNLIPRYEYREGRAANKDSHSRWSRGLQVHAHAPYLRPYLEVKDRHDTTYEFKYKVCGKDACLDYKVETVSAANWMSHIPVGWVPMAWAGDGSTETVDTVALYIQATTGP